ncbi:GrpB-like predicted nucleotidyltransferase (UPF0157 family) [Lipingzhangella halophila]|uniref:GrpB-like predicted nucleotidyltransferase (UPF0157 family) n=1 Tax=Lipingzhangella halophila TaxID=1783352 RepID=A0A7W7RLB8_9ACTN|nr:GrpB family protein [Lipingzhangella halophila]MBB4934112.1 GrpB-like predicted nucleotidyltransferase (UPF0157 family) [Lipingzhangella halophila]
MTSKDDPAPLPSRTAGSADITRGDLLLSDGRVKLADYDPKWPYLFQRETERIRDVLGAKALLVEHVGSTAIPGMVAKPCVDVVLAVADSADEDDYLPALQRAGYTLTAREPEWYEHRLFAGPDVNVSLHVFSAGCEEIERMVRFRDRLRANSEDHAHYVRTKRELAVRQWSRVQDYADAKADVVQEIIARAG